MAGLSFQSSAAALTEDQELLLYHSASGFKTKQNLIKYLRAIHFFTNLSGLVPEIHQYLIFFHDVSLFMSHAYDSSLLWWLPDAQKTYSLWPTLLIDTNTQTS